MQSIEYRVRVRDMAEDENSEDNESGKEPESNDEGAVSEDETTKPGDWERKPSDEEERRHDDDAQPPVKPSEDAGDDDQAEQEAGDAGSEDEGFDRPDTEEEDGLGDAGHVLQERAEPLLEGPAISTPAGGLPTRSLLGMLAFVVVFCVVFFVLWALMGGIGILIGIIAGTALGLGAMKLLADRTT